MYIKITSDFIKNLSKSSYYTRPPYIFTNAAEDGHALQQCDLCISKPWIFFHRGCASISVPQLKLPEGIISYD
jgi:hypothetical protein